MRQATTTCLWISSQAQPSFRTYITFPPRRPAGPSVSKEDAAQIDNVAGADQLLACPGSFSGIKRLLAPRHCGAPPQFLIVLLSTYGPTEPHWRSDLHLLRGGALPFSRRVRNRAVPVGAPT